MPGAGKSTAAEVSESLGFKVFRMGDDVRMAAEKRNVTPTDENLGAIMLQLRQSGGIVAIAVLCKERIEKDKSRFVVIDGIRNINEFFEFKKLGRAVLVSIHATPERRFKFLQARARSDSPQTFQSFEARDRRELTVGIGEAIALSDEVIVNSGSIAELKEKASHLLKRLKRDLGSK
jgi:dephospho-CoA kinase